MNRLFLGLLLCFSLSLACTRPASASPPYDSFPRKLAELEARHGGRLGVALLRTRDNTWYTHRGDERFPMCSVFKVMAVANLLQRSEREPALLQTRLTVEAKAILPYSFAIRKYLNSGISLREAGEVCLSVSDNTAAHLLLGALGGPEMVTAFARSIGDADYRLDRAELSINDAVPGDLRDTTTPVAMARSLYQILLGNVLAPPQRAQMSKWMRNCLTGDRRFLAGTPKSWTVAHKTGTGDYGATNHVGVFWPPSGPPLVLVAFYTREDDQEAEASSALLAEVARLATRPEDEE